MTMASRPYNHCSLSSQIKSRLDKCRAKSAAPAAQDVDDRSYTFDEEDEDDLANRTNSEQTVSCTDDNINDYTYEDTGADEVETRFLNRSVGARKDEYGPADRRAAFGFDDKYGYDSGSLQAAAYRPKKIVDRKAYPELTTEAVVAMQKLQLLKELQRRRDYNEKFYDLEIKRLIADVGDPTTEKPAPGTATVSLPVKPLATLHPADLPKIPVNHSYTLQPQQQPRHQPQPQQPQPQLQQRHTAGDHHRNSILNQLERCGTMTTITRLDCGCVEQMTRPIFTTPNGQVRKRSCALEQNVHVRLSAPTSAAPARLGFGGSHGGSSAAGPAVQAPPRPPPGTRLKSRSFNDAPPLGVTATVNSHINNKSPMADPQAFLRSRLNSRRAASESSA